MQELGLDAGLNYKTTPEWDRWTLDETDGEGVDLIVEVGGVGTLGRSLRAVKMGGTIAQVGVQAWPGGPKEQFIRVIPRHVTGRRIRRVPSRPEE